MRKIKILLICFLLIIINVNHISASSISTLDDTGAIDNNHASKKAIYNGLESNVYYGSNGIEIVSENKSYSIKTRFEVELLEVINLNDDDYSDYVTYQMANEFADQIFVIDGKTGEVVSSLRLTRLGFDETLGTVDKNSFIQKILSYKKDKVLIVYDYSIIMINPNTCEELFRYDDVTNIWDVEIVNDELYYTNQSGQLIHLDKELNYIEKIDLGCEEYEVEIYEDFIINASLNAWDVYYDGVLFVTTEQGALYKIVNGSAQRIDLIDSEIFEKYLYEVANSYSFGSYDEIVFNPTGIASCYYMNYRILDGNADYLLIGAFLKDEFCTSQNYNYYSQFIAIYNKKTGEISKISFNETINYADAVLAKYQDKDVVSVFVNTENGSIKYSIYNLDSTIIYENSLTNEYAINNNPINVTYINDAYYIEIYNGMAFNLANDLKTTSYIYKTVSYEFLNNDDSSFISIKKVNGIKTALVKYDFDLNALWSYEINESFINNGFEKIVITDYDNDSIDDYILVVGEYNDKNILNRYLYIIVNGKDGSLFRKDFILEGYDYDERGRLYYTYLRDSEIKAIADLDSDNKDELIIGNYVVSSKNFKIVSYYGPYVDEEGTSFEIGDYNGDGVSEIILVNKKRATIYESRKTNYDFYYEKTNKSISINEKAEPYYYSSLINDINNDGIKEIIIPDFNSNNYEVFKVYDGKTLSYMYTLCEKGVSDMESYDVLDVDINNDGYNELFGLTASTYTHVLLDGKTGEFIRTISQYDYGYDEDFNPYETDYYHPDYLIANTPGNTDIKLVFISDHFVFSYGDYDYEAQVYKSYIKFFNKETFKIEKQIELNGGMWGRSEIIKIDNTDNYLFVNVNGGYALIDIEKEAAIASFNYVGNKFIYLNDTTLLSTDVNNNINLLDIQKSFKLNEDIPEVSDNYIINVSWTSNEEFSTMSIKDNGTVVYYGCDDNCEIKLTQGKHSLTFSLSDGRGKSSTVTYHITVTEQKNNSYYVIGALAIVLFVALFINLNKKIYVRRHMKEVNA